MNPADFGMFWMNQFAQAQERMIIDDSTSYYTQPAIGMSVMDDIGHQTNSMDMNSLGLINSEFTTAAASNAMALAPELFGTTLPRTLTAGGLNQAHFHDETHQRILDHYSTMVEPQPMAKCPINQLGPTTSVNVGTGTNELYDDDDDDESEGQMLSANQFANQFVNQFTTNDDENSVDIDEEADDAADDDIDDDEFNGGTDSNQSNSVGFGATGDTSLAGDSTGSVPFRRRTKGTQTNRKIKPVKRPGLVLKTPIAYQPCLDPSVIPIQRDGMAVCERCGAIGVKHSFYTKERRFCSMTCARGDFVMMQMQAKEVFKQHDEKPQFINEKFSSTTQADTSKPAAGSRTTIMNELKEMSTESSSPIDIEAQLKASQCKIPNYRFKLSLNGDENNSNGNANGNGNGNHSLFDGMSVDDTGHVLYRDIMFEEELPQIPKGSLLPPLCPQDEKIITVRRKPSEFLNSYDWIPQLTNSNFFAAPVTCFSHAPGHDVWSMVNVGMKVEVENTDCDTPELKQGMSPHSFWVATVLRLCGYKALLRYEGFDDDNSHDFWVNLCSSEVHSVGWCAERGKPLIPPRTIENKYSWRKYLEENLTNALTLPTTFYNKINESSKSRFRVGLQMEVVNKNRISEMRVCKIHKIIGKRLLVRYFDAPEDNGFWVHEDSPLIHPVGWSIDVGHNLSAPADYLRRMQEGRSQTLEMHEDDATMDLFKMNFSYKEYFLEGKQTGFRKGMKLEAVDPLNLSSICVATVVEVLKFGYVMIRIDTYDPDVTGADLFCYHEKSACIFPPGFCQRNNIALTPPKGYDSTTFSWAQYLADTRSTPALESLFCLEVPNHGFKEGMKIECADLMDPRLVCVATIVKIVGRVVRVHFDGWEDEFDQWLDSEGPDMYPVGWCVMVGHKLEAPKPPTVQKISPKSTGKKGRRKGGRTTAKSKSLAARIVKRELDVGDQRRNEFDDLDESQNGESMSTKTETQPDFDAEDDDDDFSHDGYSHSVNSMQSTSLPPTPEPRNETPTLHTTRPSSKSSTFSVVSQHSGQATSSPPPERKAASYIQNTTITSGKFIPCLISDSVTSQSVTATNADELAPESWNISDVEQFLKINDCEGPCKTFAQNKVDGKRLLEITDDEIFRMLNMKMGPVLRVQHLITKLKEKIDKLKPSRHSTGKTSVSKKYL